MTDCKCIKTRPERNSAIELLRIISMLMIVFHHFAYHGGFRFAENTLSLPRFWYNLIDMGGKTGVNIFVLISGYFLSEDRRELPSLKRLLKFWGQVAFYSVAIMLVFSAVSGNISIGNAVNAVIPILFERWWFASTYFVLFLLHPFLNKLLNALSRDTYRLLIVILIACWSIIPTITTAPFQGGLLTWFVTLYCVAGYVKKHGNESGKTAKYFFLGWGMFTALTYLSSAIITVLGVNSPQIALKFDYFYEKNSILTFLSSLCLFVAFTKLKMKPKRWINIIASATFGVYLIHDHPFVRSFLWNDVFCNASFANSALLIPYSIFAVFTVFLVCAAIDLFRKVSVERIYMKTVDWLLNRVYQPIQSIRRKVSTLIFGDKTDFHCETEDNL